VCNTIHGSFSVEGSLDNLTNISESEPEPKDPSSPLMLDGPLSPVSFLAARGSTVVGLAVKNRNMLT